MSATEYRRNKGWYTKTTEHTLLFFAGIAIKEVVGLRPKMYSLTYDIMRKDAVWDEIIHTEEKKVAKGIAKCEIKKNIASWNV